MFIIRLGAEALSIKSGSKEKTDKNFVQLNDDLSANASFVHGEIFEKDSNLLKNLLNGCLVESALLSQDDSKVKRCQSACFQNGKTDVINNFHRPRSDTVPQSSMYLTNSKLIESTNVNSKRKIHQICENNISQKKILLYDSLSKETKQKDASSHIFSPGFTNSTMLNSFIKYQTHNHLKSDLLFHLNGDGKDNSNSSTKLSQTTISVDESKRLRQQINCLLKKIMQMIKYYSNYSSSSESRCLSFVTELWHRILVLIIVQMEPESCKILFRGLLLSIFNGKEEISFSKRDQILLMEKLQDIVRSYIWLKSNTEIFHCILFWFMSKYGYPEVFFMSQEVVIHKLKNVHIDTIQMESIFKMIQELSELSENHMRLLFCQHLPSDCSMAEFLVQWT